MLDPPVRNGVESRPVVGKSAEAIVAGSSDCLAHTEKRARLSAGAGALSKVIAHGPAVHEYSRSYA